MPAELALFLVVLNNLTISKTIRFYSMRYYRGATLCDLRDAALISAVGAGVVATHAEYGPPLLLLALAAFTLLLLCDAVLFNRYSFTINPGSIKIFAGNQSAFLDESARFFGYIRQRRFFLYPVFAIAAYVAVLGLAGPPWLARACLAGYASYTVLVYTKSRFSVAANVAGAAFALAVFGAATYWPWRTDSGFDFANPWIWALGFAAFAACVTAILPWARIRLLTPAVQLQSTVLPIAGYQATRVRRGADPHPWHQRIVPAPKVKAPPSSKFGQLHGANVILLTVESFSKFQTRAISGTGAELPFFESYLAKSSYGARHYAISPNTYQTLYTLYKGDYPIDSSMPPVGVLNQAGYQTVFMTPHRLALFDTDKLIEACRFDAVYSAETFASDMSGSTVQAWGASDRAVYEQVLVALDKQRDGRPLFLSIINSQTHLPYHVYDSARFNRHGEGGILARYLNAMEEADDCLRYLFEQLAARGLLENTLVIITGDHGESFGESNYNGHSNAVTREQLEVPFLLHHPRLAPQQFDFSTHFDVFPTIFDLLGLQSDIPLAGSSLYAADRRAEFVAYSRTYQGELPTCFGFVHPQGKLFVDMIYNRFWTMDLDDNVVSVLTGKERDSLLWSLYEGLRTRNLLGEPKIGNS